MAQITGLKKLSKQLRIDTLNLALTHNNGHIGSAYSIIEILALLYENILKKDDKFILSKGHGALSYYAVLRRSGFNPRISGHPDIDIKNGVHATTGSLGHGVAIACGMALAKKIQHKKGHIYVIAGDGECQEGEVWEAINLARHFKLDNLTVIVDHNKLQALNTTKNILSDTNLAAKFKAFGCKVVEVDGHNLATLNKAFKKSKNKPLAIIAHTVKGKGVSFMENNAKWHNCLPDEKELKICLKELHQ
jgi:transketolase